MREILFSVSKSISQTEIGCPSSRLCSKEGDWIVGNATFVQCSLIAETSHRAANQRASKRAALIILSTT